MAQCPLCGKPATKTCGRCNAAGYCSTKCQNLDQGLHYLLCKDFIAFHQLFPRPPSTIYSTHVLGLLFPDDSNTPQFVWVKLSLSVVAEYGQFYTAQVPKLNQYFGNFDPVTSQVYEFGAGYLDHTLEIWKQEKNPATCRQNQCLEYLLTGCDASEWRKSVLVLSKFADQNGDDNSLPIYQDITLSDLRVAFKFIMSDIQVMDAKEFNPFLALDEYEWYRGVEICCQKDRHMLGFKQYREVKVRKSHAIFKKGDVSEVSKVLEFSLLVMKQLPTARWVGKSAPGNVDTNIEDEPHNMMISTDYNSESWGKVDEKWNSNTEATVLVVRKDRIALTPQQVEAYVGFCVQVKEVMSRTSERQERKDLVASHMNRVSFENFFAKFMKLKVGEGDRSWAKALSPYGN